MFSPNANQNWTIIGISVADSLPPNNTIIWTNDGQFNEVCIYYLSSHSESSIHIIHNSIAYLLTYVIYTYIHICIYYIYLYTYIGSDTCIRIMNFEIWNLNCGVPSISCSLSCLQHVLPTIKLTLMVQQKEKRYSSYSEASPPYLTLSQLVTRDCWSRDISYTLS